MMKTRIMIVEDEYIICEEMRNMLENLGYGVAETFDNAEDAIAWLDHERPDLALMDIRLQGKMDGIEAAEVIRRKHGIPVVFSTAYVDKERIERAKVTMPFGYLLKPIQERDLKVTVEMALYVAKVETERRQAEAALMASEKRYKNLIELLPMGLFEIDDQGTLLFVNRRFCEMYGYSEEELTGGFNIFRLVAPEEREKAIANSKRVMDEMKFGGIEYTGITKNGVKFPTIIHSSHIRQDDKSSQLGITIDLSQRIKTKDET